MAAVAGVGEHPLDLVADGFLDVGNDGRQRVAVTGIAGQSLRRQREVAALRALQRGGERDFDAEFVGPVRLALADAFDLRRMQAVDLATALALPLLQDRRGLVERPKEDGPQLLVIADLAANVANGAAEIDPERPQRFVGPPELLGVGVALVLDQLIS